jgi:hypothetical protein
VIPNRRAYEFYRERGSELRQLSDEDFAAVMGTIEGGWGEVAADNARVSELNLRSYAHAQRFVYGTQQTVCAVHTAARARPADVIRLAHRPPSTSGSSVEGENTATPITFASARREGEPESALPR